MYIPKFPIKASEYSPSFALRYNFSASSYWGKQDLINKIEERLLDSGIALITSKPYLGKSQAIFEYLNHKNKWPTLLLENNLQAIDNVNEAELDSNILVVIDDLAKLLDIAEIAGKLEKLNKFIGILIKKKAKIIAACRDGFSIKEIFNSGRLSYENSQIFTNNRLIIPSLTKDQLEEIPKFLNKKIDPIELKNGLGYYLLNLAKLNENYLSEYYRKNKVADFNKQLNILKAVLFISQSNNFFNKKIPLVTIKKYIKADEKKAVTNVSYNPFQSFFGENAEVKKNTSDPIADSVNTLSNIWPALLKIEDESIVIDSTLAAMLLDKININIKKNNNNTFQNLNELFTFDQQKELNFWSPPLYWQKQKFKFTKLNKENLDLILEDIEKYKIPLSKNCLNSILLCIDSFDLALDFYNKYCLEHKDERQLHILFKKISQSSESAIINELFKKEQVKPLISDKVYILPRLSNWNDQVEILNSLKNEPSYKENLVAVVKKINVGSNFINLIELLGDDASLIKKEDYAEIIQQISSFRNFTEALSKSPVKIVISDIKINENKIGEYFKNSTSWEETKQIKELAEMSKYKLNISDYQNIVRTAPSIGVIADLQDEIKKNKLTLTLPIYNELIKKTENIKDSLIIYQQMLEAKIRPDQFTFSNLFRKAYGHYVGEVYQELNNANITPNYGIFRNMIMHSKQLSVAIRWLFEMLSWNILTSEDIIEKLEKIATKSSEKLPAEIDEIKKSYHNNPLIVKNDKPNIFISYAHKSSENVEKIIPQLTSYNVFYDIKNKNYKETLFKFWHRVAPPKIVLVLLDEYYWQSPFCLSELKNIVDINAFRVKMIVINTNGTAMPISAEEIEAKEKYWLARKLELEKLNSENQSSSKITRELKLVNEFLPSIKSLAYALSKASIINGLELADIITKKIDYKLNERAYNRNSNNRNSKFSKNKKWQKKSDSL